MSAQMRAAVITKPGHFELVSVPIPAPGPQQIRIRLEGSGICGSNLPPFEGREWFKYPLPPGQPGHEGWGVVEAVGNEVKGFREGDRVAAISSAAFAEYDVVDAAAAVRLAPELHDQPFPGEPLGCAMNVFRRSDIHAGDTVAIIGIGFLGAVLTQLAVAEGAKVIAITRRRFAQDVARSAGAHEVLPLGDRWANVHRIGELTGGKLCDRVIECVGLQEPLDLATDLTRERGRLVIAGYHQDGNRTVNMQQWNWRGLDVINAHERDPAVYAEGVRLAAEAVRNGRIRPRELYTHSFSLEQIGDAFASLRDRPEGFLKALVKP